MFFLVLSMVAETGPKWAGYLEFWTGIKGITARAFRPKIIITGWAPKWIKHAHPTLLRYIRYKTRLSLPLDPRGDILQNHGRHESEGQLMRVMIQFQV